VHVHAELWMVGLLQVPHSNQDTQISIEFYHRVLKRWFSLKTKGLWGALHWLVNVEVNHNCGMTLYAPSWDEETKVHKKQGHGIILWWQVLTKLIKFHTPMWSHLPLKGMMVMMFGRWEANTILVLLIRFVPLSPNMQVALVNGNYIHHLCLA